MQHSSLISLVGLLAAVVAVGCSGSDFGSGSGSDGATGATSGSGEGAVGAASSGTGDFGGPITGGGSGGSDGGTPQAGMLTAADWDDNLNFDLFRAYVDERLANDPTEVELESADRVVLRVVTSNNAPVLGAQVKITDAANTYFSGPTGSDGRVLFFPKHDGAAGKAGLTVNVAPPSGQVGVPAVSLPAPQGSEWVITLPGAASTLPTKLDLAFVVDTTGSMGDELEYLKAEMQGIADAVHGDFGNVSIQYGLVLYRDIGDDYVTRTFDFTSDLAKFKLNLGNQSAGGGGDQPEAMDEALAQVPQLAWRSGDVAKLTFLVADAPPHAERAGVYLTGVNDLRGLGIKLYPVAASGVADEAEYLMRVGAEATLGRYLFLTDDSGIGDPHQKPHIPCYQVQRLDKLVVRMIASELTGNRVPADPADVIRTVGDPMNGVCTLPGGDKAYF